MTLLQRSEELVGARAVERGVLLALAYADVFDYPLTPAELHRYLVGARASLADVLEAAERGLAAGLIERADGFLALRGRGGTAAKRRRRAEHAAYLWRRARRYGAMIARLPFVRMVAVTGALAMDNVEPGADIDYLIVTEPGRLWLCRALAIALVRLAARRGDTLCPNYLISERALDLPERGLYAAHELAQMVPLAGMGVYAQLRRRNAWADALLPNASGPPERAQGEVSCGGRATALAEAALRTRLGEAIERGEMARKVAKLGRQGGAAAEAGFTADWCKGHFEGHGLRTLAAFEERCRALGVAYYGAGV